MIFIRWRLVVGLLLATTTTSWAQQNLFNIPSGDITPKRKIFYQHQLNVYRQKFESKGHFVYGLGGGWDAGMNVVGKGAYFTPEWRLLHNDQRQRGAVYPLILATLQKQFVLSERTMLNLGTQSGVNISRFIDRKQFAHFTYGLVSQTFGPGRKLIGGAYVTNTTFAGTGNNVGVLFGYEWRLTDKWYLMGDWLSGRNDTGVGVAGLMFWPGKRVQFCAGALIPNPRTPKPPGVVLEINILGWDAHH